VSIDASTLRHGRYFRENFAQAGIDLTQIIRELGGVPGAWRLFTARN
jgi:hypothetical protein